MTDETKIQDEAVAKLQKSLADANQEISRLGVAMQESEKRGRDLGAKLQKVQDKLDSVNAELKEETNRRVDAVKRADAAEANLAALQRTVEAGKVPAETPEPEVSVSREEAVRRIRETLKADGK